MSEMVERCTDALLRAFFSRPVDEQYISITAQDQYDLMRAIFKELSEPTGEMIASAMMPYVYGNDEAMNTAFRATIAGYWRAMIDEMLK